MVARAANALYLIHLFLHPKSNTMKFVYLACFSLVLFFSCKEAETKTETPASEPASSVPAASEFAYAIDQPVDNWSPGDLKNVVMVLKSLKAMENGDVDGSVAYFADSVLLEMDQFEAKLSRDSAANMFKQHLTELKSMKIEMDDWESVISKDKKTEIVSLWYKQINTMKNGAVDSMQVMDDLRIENGKIASINEKTRRYQAKK